MKNPINFDKIPDRLKSIPHWVVWAYVERDGKLTKPPFDVNTGKPGDATDPKLWRTFDEIVELSKCPYYDGIGFAIQDTGLTCIDLDNCIDENGNMGWAKDYVDRLDSFSEITPSGKGLHIWVEADLPKEGRRKGSVEMYNSGRYLTVTGRHLEGTPADVMPRQTELDFIHAEIFHEPKKEPARKGSKIVDMNFDDDEILRRAFANKKNGADIQKLFNGDMSDYADDSADGVNHSDADMALCSHLAWWFGRNLDSVDRVFRKSGLMRDKWERDDYRKVTLEKACEGNGSYDPDYKSEPAPLIEPARNGHANGQPPREPGEDDHGEEPEGITHRTDLGNARILVDMHGDDIKYVHPWEKWIMWRGNRWEEDRKGYVTTLSRNVIRRWHKECELTPFGVERDKLYKYAMSCESNARIGAMVNQAKFEPGIAVSPDELDHNPWQLNCINGTIDLATGKLSPHIRSDFITKMCNAKYDPNAKCLKFLAFLDKIMNGNIDMISFLKRCSGYTAVGVVYEHVLLFLYGQGSNGKSTFVNTMQYVLGDYGITINAEILMENKFTPHSTGITDLMGRRWVSTIEVEEGKTLAESLVKALTGNDKIRARRLYEDHFEFIPTHTIWLAANHAPEIKGTDHAIWRRIKQIPFDVTIADADQDKTLPFQLQDEASGILNWIIEGCLEWKSIGINEPKEVVEATLEYKNESDELAGFFNEYCIKGEKESCEHKVLYSFYRRWARIADSKNIMSSNMFGRQCKKRGYKQVSSGSKTTRHGIGLKETYRSADNSYSDSDSGETVNYGEMFGSMD